MILRKIILILCILNLANGEIIMNESNGKLMLEHKIFQLTDEEYLKNDDVKFQLEASKDLFNHVVIFELSFELASSADPEQQDILTKNIPSYRFRDLGTGFIEKIFDIKLAIYFDDKKVDSFFITRDRLYPAGAGGIEKGEILKEVTGIHNDNKQIETYFLLINADDLLKVRLEPTVYLKNSNPDVNDQKISISARIVNLFNTRHRRFVYAPRETRARFIYLINYSDRYNKLAIKKIIDRLVSVSHRPLDHQELFK